MKKLISALTIVAMLSGCVKVDYTLDLKTPTPIVESAKPSSAVAPTPTPDPEATLEPSPSTSPSPSPSPTPTPEHKDGWILRILKWVSGYTPPSSETNSSEEVAAEN